MSPKADHDIKWEYLALTRFCLAMIVFFSHLSHFFNGIPIIPEIAKFGGFEAVLGFLLISGYSIAHSIKKNPQYFYKRRFLRIFPIYFASLVLFYWVNGFDASSATIFTGLGNLFFLNGVFFTNLLRVNWSLSLEIWLYALAPVLLKWRHRTLQMAIYISLFCYIIYSVGEGIFRWPYFSNAVYGINLPVLAFAWFAGFGLGVYKDEFKKFKLIVFSAFGIHILMLLGFHLFTRIKHHNLQNFFHEDLLIILLRLACLFCIGIVVCYNGLFVKPNQFTNKVFTLLGDISYPLYLTHLTIINLMKKWQLQSIAMLMFMPIVVALLIYLAFDFYPKIRKHRELASTKQPIF